MAKHGLGVWLRSRTARLVGIVLSGVLLPSTTNAQVLPDETLGTQVNGSNTLPCSGFCQITNGTTRGSNLFHSFQQFSLPNGDVAAFITNPAIQNVLVRVTGADISDINGVIATTDPTITNVIPTNFFLLNPNGIVFGPNARILVGGAFLASTAERLLFQDGTVFNTRDRTTNPLLTVNLPVGLQMGRTPGTIQVQQSTQLNSGTGGNSQFGSFTLVGGEIAVENSIISAPGQRIELGALASEGTVELKSSGNTLQLGSFGNSERSNITLANRARLQTFADDGGNIAVYGRDVILTEFSSLFTGILPGLGTITSQSGDITIDATGTVRLFSGSQVASIVTGIGNSGRISISGQRIELVNGSIVGSASVGLGNAGAVEIKATEAMTFSGRNANGIASGVISSVGSVFGFSGNGNGGNILLQAPIIQLQDGSLVGASTVFSQGNAGNIRVEASNRLTVTDGSNIQASTSGNGNAGKVEVIANTIALDGVSLNDLTVSSIASEVQNTAIGNGGDITLTADTLSITNGARITTSTFGNGNAGNVQVNARTTLLDGVSSNSSALSGIGSTVESIANGDGGNVTVTTDTLSVTNGARITASTLGKGNAGDIRVIANEVILGGIASDGRSASNILSNVESGSVGNSGDIEIKTGSLTVTNGAQIQTIVRQPVLASDGTIFLPAGRGNAGNIQLFVQGNTTIDGTGVFSVNGFSRAFFSEIASGLDIGATGRAGTITLNTGSLSITNGGRLISSTFGQGDAGNVAVNARTIALDGISPDGLVVSGISSAVAGGATGDGGDVTIATDTLSVTNGARITASTLANGNAGNVQVTADAITVNGTAPNGGASSTISSQVELAATGDGGDLTLATKTLNIIDGAFVSASTFGNGNAGDVTIFADTIALNGSNSNGLVGSSIASQIGATGNGTGGNVKLTTGTLKVTGGAFISASTFGNGNAGDVAISADTISLDGTTPNGLVGSNIGSSVEPRAVGTGGNVRLTTGNLSITNGAFISASTFSNGNAGDVQVFAKGITIDGTSSNGLSSSGIFTTSTSFSRAGSIFITTSQLRLDNRGFISTTSAAADGGNITLNIDELLLSRRGSQISATAGLAQGSGNGGNITINAPNGFIIGVKSENSDITANAFSGSGGRVNITAQGIFGLQFRPRLTEFSDITASSTFGVNGIVTLNTPNVDPSRGLAQLPQNLIDTNRILASSCLVRDAASAGTFIITGTGGLPVRPGDAVLPTFATGDVRSLAADDRTNETDKIPTPSVSSATNLLPTHSLVEAQGIYQLPDGQIILSWECAK